MFPWDLNLQQKYKTVLKTNGFNFKDVLKNFKDIFAVNIRVWGTEIVQVKFQTSQHQFLKSQSQNEYKQAKERYDKLKKPKDSDKACLQKMTYKLETTRTYLNTPSSTKSTRKAPKLRNSRTTPIIRRKCCFSKKELWVRLHSRDKEIMKLRKKPADFKDKYEKFEQKIAD